MKGTSSAGIPNGWQKTTVGDLFKVCGGGTPSTKVAEFWFGTIPWITSADIDEDHHISSRRRITRAAIASSATNLVPEGSAIVATRVSLGKVGLASEPICFSQDCQALIFDPDCFDSRYVVLHMSWVASEFRHIGRGTTINGITKKQLLDASFLLPPVKEQRRIVGEVEKQYTRLDAAVEALKRVKANLKRYRASVLKAACEGRLVPTEAELAQREGRSYEPASELLKRILAERRARWEADQLAKFRAAGKEPKDDKWKAKYKEPTSLDTSKLSGLPECWVWASVDQITSLITSGSRGWARYYSDSGQLFIRAQDIKTDRLELGTLAHVQLPARIEGARTLVRASDILVTITGANVTKTAIVHQDLVEAYVSQHVALVRPVISDLSGYAYFWITSPSHGRHDLERLAYGAGKPGLNLDNLRELLIAIPPLKEQARIVAEIERRFSVIDETEMQVDADLKRAERLRQAILKRAFEGKLVPQDPGDEPASILLERIRTEQRPAFGRRGKRNTASSEGHSQKVARAI